MLIPKHPDAPPVLCVGWVDGGAVPESGLERRREAHRVRERVEKSRRKRPNERNQVREPRAVIL